MKSRTLLLPARSHAATGLMSANMDLNRVRIGAFRFSSQEAALMVERLSNNDELATN